MKLKKRNFDEQLQSPEFLRDPFPTYRALRDVSPIYWSEAWGVWVLTRYSDVMAILKQPNLFSNKGRFARFLDSLPESVQADVAPLRKHYAAGMIQSDPPDHTRLRDLVRLAFTPKVVEGLRDAVQRIVGELLDSAGYDEFDLVDKLAFPLPLMVISALLGVPDADRDRILVWSQNINDLQSTGAAQAERARLAARSMVEIEEYFGVLCAERRSKPQDDLISQMLAAQQDSDRLTEAEMINMCVTFLIAGHETTKLLIGSAVQTLYRLPEQLELLRGDPSLYERAVEEVLRYESPIQRGWRLLADDANIGGHQMRKGQLVFMMFGAANRDPSQFDDPERFDIRRGTSRHMAFGYGIHFCIGAPLARLEAPIALRSLIDRFPRLRLSGEAEATPSIHMRGPRKLPVAVS
jgi:pimeloyl-[acyl-carrier protein] synthase